MKAKCEVRDVEYDDWMALVVYYIHVKLQRREKESVRESCGHMM